MATNLFYSELINNTKAKKDQDHIDVVILGHASMPDRTEAILSNDYDKIQQVYNLFYADAKKLEMLGCSAIAVTCNTAHYFINMLENKISIPVIHMIRETVKVCPNGKIGILATDGTIQSRLYQDELKKAGFETYEPDEEIQKKVMYEIYNCIKEGKPTDKSVWNEIETAMKSAKCTKVILACTELSVIRQELELDDFYIDALQVLALRSIEYIKG